MASWLMLGGGFYLGGRWKEGRGKREEEGRLEVK